MAADGMAMSQPARPTGGVIFSIAWVARIGVNDHVRIIIWATGKHAIGCFLSRHVHVQVRAFIALVFPGIVRFTDLVVSIACLLNFHRAVSLTLTPVSQ